MLSLTSRASGWGMDADAPSCHANGSQARLGAASGTRILARGAAVCWRAGMLASARGALQLQALGLARGPAYRVLATIARLVLARLFKPRSCKELCVWFPNCPDPLTLL